MKKILFLMRLMLLGPILPILGIPSESGEAGNSGDNSGNSDGDNNNDDGAQNDDGSSGDGDNGGDDDGDGTDPGKTDTKTFTQAEIDKIIEKRLKRERKNFQKEFDDQKKRDQMSEAEKLKADKEAAEKKAEDTILKANKRLIASEVKYIASKLNIQDPDAAFLLMDKEDIDVDEDGKVTGVEDSLKILIKNKPYLVGTQQQQQTNVGDSQNNNTGNNKNKFSMNELIRRAAGRE